MKKERKNTSKQSFKNAIESARQEYFSWPKDIFCPYFQSNVAVTRSGWNHVMKKQRGQNQKYWRARNLYLIPNILEKTTTVQRHTVEFSNQNKLETSFWSFVSVEKDKIIEVVVREISNQGKHFYSLAYKGKSPRMKHKK